MLGNNQFRITVMDGQKKSTIIVLSDRIGKSPKPTDVKWA